MKPIKIDHTKIEMTTDPLVKRFEGTARHGNTAFDVPFISHIVGNLYTGGCSNGLILPEVIQHVVSLYPWEKYTINHPIKSFTEFKAYDDDISMIGTKVRPIVDHVLKCLESGPTLVHCQAGLNRSGLIAALVLVRLGNSPVESIVWLRRRRSPAVLCNTSFEHFILSGGKTE